MRIPKLLLLTSLALSPAVAQPTAVLFEGARLIIGDGSAPIENSAFLIENNKFTKTAAEIVKLDQLGTVAAGKSADFLVLDANPLDNINNTRRIAKVYLRGKELDRAAWMKP